MDTNSTLAAAPARPLVPALRSVTDSLSPLAEPMVRFFAGFFLVPHGAQKLFGWFGGYGLEGTAGFFGGQLGLEPGIFWAFLVGAVEFFGGLMLAIGFLTRPAALASFVLLIVATFMVHFQNGFFNTSGGYEYPLLWAIVTLAFVIRGGGRYSVDAAIGREF